MYRDHYSSIYQSLPKVNKKVNHELSKFSSIEKYIRKKERKHRIEAKKKGKERIGIAKLKIGTWNRTDNSKE